MSASAFDPDAPLPGPPDPWASTTAPSPREGPPFHMTEMIAAEPSLVGRILARHTSAASEAASLASAVSDTLRAGRPVIATGCGTSEHAALGIVEILREAAHAADLPATLISAEQAFELALDPPRLGLVIAVSHEGGTAATNAALRAGRSAGARTALITVSERSPGGSLVDLVVTTGELDQSWCHTVGYVSPLAAAVAVAGFMTDRPVSAGAPSGLLAAGLNPTDAAEAIAATFADADHLLVIASGADRVAGRELVLKVEEASWLPSAYRDLETVLHGHLPANDANTGLVLVLTDRRRRAERIARARDALAAARIIGLQTAAIVSEEVDRELASDLTPAGRLVIPEAPELPAATASLLGTAVPLQLLTERIARARGTNPDSIRRDDPVYREAAAAGEG